MGRFKIRKHNHQAKNKIKRIVTPFYQQGKISLMTSVKMITAHSVKFKMSTKHNSIYCFVNIAL